MTHLSFARISVACLLMSSWLCSMIGASLALAFSQESSFLGFRCALASSATRLDTHGRAQETTKPSVVTSYARIARRGWRTPFTTTRLNAKEFEPYCSLNDTE